MHFARVGFRIQGLATKLECGLGSRVWVEGFGVGRELSENHSFQTHHKKVHITFLSPYVV